MLNLQTAPYGAFVLRLSLGIMFIAHALLKVKDWQIIELGR